MDKELQRLQAENSKWKIVAIDSIIEQEKLVAKVNELQAENEQLKQSIDRIMQNNEIKTIDLDIAFENQKLKQENERLKKQYNCYACDSCGGKEDYINMKRHTENAIKTVHKYSQALQDIKDIADRTDGNHPASVINMVSVIRHTINSVIGAEE